MTLAFPWALTLLGAIPIAWLLSRRARRARRVTHPFWFLAVSLASGGRDRARRQRITWVVLLAALTALALGASGPIAASAPDAPVQAASPNACAISAELVRATTQSRSGVLVARVVGSPTDHSPRELLVADAHGRSIGRAPVPPEAGAGEVIEIPYHGDGNETLSVVLRSASGDLHLEVAVPRLLPQPVYLVPALAGTSVAAALRALPTVVLVDAPQAEAVVVADSRERARELPGTAVLLWLAAPSGRSTARLVDSDPLAANLGSPLRGLTPDVLGDLHPKIVPVDAPAGATVWLRAGALPAVYASTIDGRPTVTVALAPDNSPHGLGVGLPILLADLFAEVPLWDSRHSTLAREGEADEATAELASPDVSGGGATGPGATRAPAWPTYALFALAALLLIGLISSDHAELLPSLLRGGCVAVILATLSAGLQPMPRRVVVLVDVSQSVVSSRCASRQVRAAVDEAIHSLALDDQVGMVWFAEGATVKAPLGARASFVLPEDLTGEVGLSREATNVTAAIGTAAALLGREPGEILLVTDGYDTDIGAEAAARLSATPHRLWVKGINRCDLAQLSSLQTAVVGRVGERVLLPLRIEVDDAAMAEVGLHEPLRGRLDLRDAGGRTVATQEAALAPGENVRYLPFVLGSQGTELVGARLSVDGDEVAANNEVTIPVVARGPATVLHVSADTVSTLPVDSAALAAYDLIALDGVGPAVLGLTRLAALARYVEQSGGTLLVSGDEASLGADGYRGTAFAEALPLTLASADSADAAAVVLVVDRSGSMAPVPAGDHAFDATAMASLAVNLPAQTLFGVVTFDVTAQVARPLAPIAASTSAARSIELPIARGGTDPRAALALAQELFAAAPSRTRALVTLVSDGRFAGRADETREAVRALVGVGIRVATVSSGSSDETGRNLLQELGQLGGGGFHALDDGGELAPLLPSLLPAGVASSAVVDRRSGVPVFRTAWLRHFDRGSGAAAKVGRGAILSHVKAAVASDATALADIGADPLLAVRSWGAGRILAMSAGLGPRACSRGLATYLLGAIAAQATRRGLASLSYNLAPTSSANRLAITAELLDVEPLAPGGHPREITVDLESPIGTTLAVPLVYRGLGRYASALPTPVSGVYRGRLRVVSMRDTAGVSFLTWVPPSESRGLAAAPATHARSGVYLGGFAPRVPNAHLVLGACLAVGLLTLSLWSRASRDRSTI